MPFKAIITVIVAVFTARSIIMFKRLTTIALVLGMSSFAYAGADARQISEESEVFVGVELGAVLIQGDTDGTILGEKNHEGSGVSVGLRLGAQNAMWRSMVLFDYFNSDDDDQTYERAMVQVDYYIMAANFNTTAFRPYIGVNAGYANYETTNKPDINGFTYGGQVGFTAAVSDTIDFDVAYRHAFAGPDELDHIGNVVFGVNYLY